MTEMDHDKEQQSTAASNQQILVEVCYALSDKQTLLQLEVEPLASIEDALRQSGILELHPEIDLTENKVGVFSKLAKLEDTLHQGDRVEIYRPLLIDPKEVRKQRALKAKKDAKSADNNKKDK